MSTYVLVGATGTVGRELAADLAGRPDSSVFAVSRNRVLLDDLAGRLDCTPISLEVGGDADPRQLPEADVVVDLTYAGGRHPRALVRSAEATVSFYRRYLELHPGARLVHTGTWVVTPRDGDPRRLNTSLLWDDTYVLAKTAAERALARGWMPGRMLVVRLGNVLTPDSAWGIGLLRTLRAGRVADPTTLAMPAGLSTVAELADLVVEGSERDLEQTDAGAGWSWGEVLESAGRELELEGAWETDGAAPPTAARSASRLPTPGAVLHRALWATPLYLDEVSLDRPSVRRIVGMLQGIRGGNSVDEIQRLPPGLKRWNPVPGWRREHVALEAFTKLLTDAFVTRRYRSSSVSSRPSESTRDG